MSIGDAAPVAEGDTATFTLTLSKAVPYDVTVDVQPGAGDGSAGDFNEAVQDITIPANNTTGAPSAWREPTSIAQ